MPLRPCDVEETFRFEHLVGAEPGPSSSIGAYPALLVNPAQTIVADTGAPTVAAVKTDKLDAAPPKVRTWRGNHEEHILEQLHIPYPPESLSPSEFSPASCPFSPLSPLSGFDSMREAKQWRSDRNGEASGAPAEADAAANRTPVGFGFGSGQEIQASCFTSEARQVFRTAHFHLVGDYLDRCVNLYFGDGSYESIRLFGTRMDFGDLTGTPDDVQPSFVKNSICLQDAGATSGWFLACRTAQDLAGLTDSLCMAGCIMRDLAEHCHIARDTADHLKRILSTKSSSYELVPVRPKSSRAGTKADKVILKVSILDNERTLLLNEVQFLLTLNHVGIPQAYGIYDMKLKGERVMAMLTDVSLKGTPLSACITAGGIAELALADPMAQLCDVLVYLESMAVVHRNVKPENVLFQRAEAGGVRVVLIDFGQAARVDDAAALSLRCGSPGFIAPELFLDDRQAGESDFVAAGPNGEEITKIDVFAFGMLISTVLTGKNPFHGQTHGETYRNNATLKYTPGAHHSEIRGISDALRSLLAALCTRNPLKRYSASEAASHPWFVVGRQRVPSADLHQLRVRYA
jgi:serine/threonine protein kinase